MTNINRSRVVMHAGVVLLVGLLCGYPTLVETLGGDAERLWRTAHEELIMIGILLLATASAFPSIALPRREATGLVWSLVAGAYGLMTGLVLGAVVGVQAFGPSRSPVVMIAFVGNAIGILGSMTAALLLIMGARTAIAGARHATLQELS